MTIILPQYDVKGKIGRETGSNISSALEGLANRKLQQMEYEHNRKNQLNEMFQNQQIQQVQKEREKQQFFGDLKEAGIDSPSAFMQWAYRNNPKAMEHVPFPGDKQSEFARKGSAQELSEKEFEHKKGIDWAKVGLGKEENEIKRGELTYKTGFDEREFARKEKKLGLELERDKAALAHTAHTENMDKQQLALKTKEIEQNYKQKRDELDFDKKKARESSGESGMHAAVNNRAAYEFNKKYMEEARNKRTSAREMDQHFQIMEQLNNSDKLINPALYSTMKSLHLDFPVFVGKYAEIYGKEQAGLLGGLKGVFGSRVTNFDLGQFQKGLPTLENTKEGRAIMLNNLKVANGFNNRRTWR
jgi:hypothetical protein